MNNSSNTRTPTSATPAVAPAANQTAPTLLQNAASNGSFKTFGKAVEHAGLTDTLSAPGPFTVFAPTDAAFAKLPAGTVETLVKPENKAALTGILTYHVVAGRLDAKALSKQVKDGGGSATLTTVKGDPLTVTAQGKSLVLTDAKGGTSTVTIGDVYQSNGVIHVVDSVLLP